jgi:hypothetical protein
MLLTVRDHTAKVAPSLAGEDTVVATRVLTLYLYILITHRLALLATGRGPASVRNLCLAARRPASGTSPVVRSRGAWHNPCRVHRFMRS